MPRRGIHPLVRTATLVLRNGASISIETVAPATKPVMLSVDPSVHPRWTGDASAVASEDGRLAKFARKFEGGVVSTTGGGGSGAKKGEKKK